MKAEYSTQASYNVRPPNHVIVQRDMVVSVCNSYADSMQALCQRTCNVFKTISEHDMRITT